MRRSQVTGRSGATVHWPKSGSGSRRQANRAECDLDTLRWKSFRLGGDLPLRGERRSRLARGAGGWVLGDLWLQLADAREHDHPADAAPIYLKQAEAEIIREWPLRRSGPVTGKGGRRDEANGPQCRIRAHPGGVAAEVQAETQLHQAPGREPKRSTSPDGRIQ